MTAAGDALYVGDERGRLLALAAVDADQRVAIDTGMERFRA
jgi:hypothetical protein